LGKRAVLPLIDRLHSEDQDLREKAAEVLGKLHDDRATEPLIDALSDKEAEVRWRAAAALGEMKDPAAGEPLIKALRDPEESVRSKRSPIPGRRRRWSGRSAMVTASCERRRHGRWDVCAICKRPSHCGRLWRIVWPTCASRPRRPWPHSATRPLSPRCCRCWPT